MKTNTHLIYALCILLTTVSTTTCTSATPKNRLIGKWQQVGGQKIVQEFKHDGTTVSTSIEAPDPVTGKYELINEGSLKITDVVVGRRTESALFLVAFSEDGKRMKLENDSGFSATFEKLE